METSKIPPSLKLRRAGKINKFLILGVFLLALFGFANDVKAAVKAFPTAEGFGANAIGGRGGRVIEVMNLNDSGVGSFRACAEATGARICVFRVGGTIVLNSVINIRGADRSYLTIAGQTAPGDGVQLKNRGIEIAEGAHDIVIRYIKIRQGTDLSPQNINNDCEGITIYGPSNSSLTYNIIVDHVSLEWICDDSFQFYGDTVRDTTLQWSLIGEGLTGNDYRNANGEAANSKGTLPAGSNANWTYHHNLFVHSGSRNPYSKGGPNATATLDWRNNIGYNWNACQGNVQLGEYNEYGILGNDASLLANFVGNKYIAGPNTASTCYVGSLGGIQTRIYIQDNSTPYCRNGCSSLSDLGFVDATDWQTPASDTKFRTFAPFNAPAIAMTPLSTLESVLAAKAGATVPVRDSLDTRLINEFQTRAGDLGRNGATWPVLASGTPPPDTDHDSMPDAWESSHDLNPNNAADGPVVASNGYTNVENYLNELAGDAIPGNPYTSSAPSADLNSDSKVNSVDAAILMGAWGQTSRPKADINQDGIVNSVDASLMMGQWTN